MNRIANSRNRIFVCETENRWTRLIRRQEQKLGAEVIQIPGHSFLGRGFSRSGASVVLVELDESNVEAVAEWVRLEKTAGHSTIFVGLFRQWQPKNAWSLRLAGLDACYFSLADVQSLIDLAQRFFRSVPDADGSASELDWETLPDSETFRESLPLPE